MHRWCDILVGTDSLVRIIRTQIHKLRRIWHWEIKSQPKKPKLLKKTQKK